MSVSISKGKSSTKFDQSRGQAEHIPSMHIPGAVKVWAAIGAAVIAAILYALVRWIFSDDFVATPVGTDVYPYLTYLRIVEGFSILFLGYFFVSCVVVPWIRNRRLSFDGRLYLACLTVQFIDPVFNYFTPSFIENSYSVNRGSWANFIPGWASPAADAGLVEGLIWALALYGLFGIVAAIGGCLALKQTRALWPKLGNVAHYVILFIVIAVLDILVEYYLFVRPQIYIFWGAWSPFTLLSGRLDQFPLYETLLATIYAMGFVWLRDFRDDEGFSFPERGVNRLKLGQAWQTLISFCALTGFSLIWAIVSYFAPFNFAAMKSDAYPPLPSYLQGGAFCGHSDRPMCPSQYLKQVNDTYKQARDEAAHGEYFKPGR